MKTLFAVTASAMAAIGLLISTNTRAAGQATSTRELTPLQLEEQIPIPGVPGRIDHFSADAKRKRLFISALGNNSVEVIDVFAGKVMQSIKGLSEPQGVLYVLSVAHDMSGGDST